jgi:hypothetical protein
MMARGAVRGNTFFSGALLGSDSGCKAPSKGQHRGSSDIVGQSFIFLGTPAFFLKKKRINKWERFQISLFLPLMREGGGWICSLEKRAQEDIVSMYASNVFYASYTYPFVGMSILALTA